LSARFYHGGAGTAMDSLAQMVAAAGIKHVKGDIIGDATAFESKRIPDGWLSRYLGAGYAARVSSLSMNDNLAVVRISPSSGGASVVLDPPSSTIPIVNNVTVTGGGGSRVSVHLRPDGSIEARGTIGARSGPVAYQLVVDDPALYTTGAFASALATQRIAVDGHVRLGAAPNGATKVTSL